MGNYDFELDLESKNTMSVIAHWIRPESDVLEFGPANGRLTRYLAEQQKCNMTIVEIDEEAGKEAAQYARKSFLGEEYGDIEKGYWQQNETRFDYIVFADVLEHLRNPKKVLENCKKMLKEDGRILVSIPNVTHNSVIINMLNDEFEYDNVGLLDHTHIHFFSYKSFTRMVQECGCSICEIEPIYSRVANNEIQNSYSDVPVEVEKYLRKRVQGSIYQYVCNISGKEEAEQRALEIKGLELDEHEILETQCFYRRREESAYQDAKRITHQYAEGDRVFWEIELGTLENAEKVRWDPMEYSGIVWLDQCVVVNEEKSYSLEVESLDASCRYKNLVVFDTSDPWIEFASIPEEYRNGKLVISFYILEYKKTPEFYGAFVSLLENMGLPIEKIVGNENEKVYIESLEHDVEEQRQYIEHLERDLGEQRQYVGHLEHDLGEQRQYIEHLEHDIAELKEYMQKLERKKR